MKALATVLILAILALTFIPIHNSNACSAEWEACREAAQAAYEACKENGLWSWECAEALYKAFEACYQAYNACTGSSS